MRYTKTLFAIVASFVMLAPCALVISTQDAEAVVVNHFISTEKEDAFQEWQGTYQRVEIKIYRQNNTPGILADVTTYQTSDKWLGRFQNIIHFDHSPILTHGDNEPSTGYDPHFYTTFYGYLPRNGQNYDGLGHVGTAGGYLDVQTGVPQGNIGGPNAYQVTPGDNTVTWDIYEGRWQSSWNGLTVSGVSSGMPSEAFNAFVKYQTADWRVFWWDVNDEESHYFNIPKADFI